MNKGAKITQSVEHLASMIYAIQISSYAGVFGMAGTDSALLQMRKAAAELVQAARKGEGIEAGIANMEAALLAAGAIGLLSQSELQEYLNVIDGLRVTTEERES